MINSDNIDFDEHYFIDLNWYFADRLNRICIVASAGGILPDFLTDDRSRNDEFHQLVMDLEERYGAGRNERAIDIIIDLNLNEDIDDYFRDFESLARKGLYVYDKVDINDSKASKYILVCYPLYDTEKDRFPFDPNILNIIPKLKEALISRTNTSFSSDNFDPIEIIQIVNTSYGWDD